MFVSKNRKNRTYFVGNRGEGDPAFNVYYSVSFPRAKRRSLLTLKVGGKRVDLTGRQIRTLRSVLEKAEQLANPLG